MREAGRGGGGGKRGGAEPAAGLARLAGTRPGLAGRGARASLTQGKVASSISVVDVGFSFLPFWSALHAN